MRREPDGDSVEQETIRQAEAMKARLRKDVASWSAERNETSVAEIKEPLATQPPPRPTRKAKKANPTAPGIKPAVTGKKPFSMSYGGTTTAEHIQYMIARGAR